MIYSFCHLFKYNKKFSPSLATDFTLFSGVFIVDFEQIHVSWVSCQTVSLRLQQIFTCSKTKIETLEKGVKHVQS